MQMHMMVVGIFVDRERMSNNQRIVITNYYKGPWSLIEVQFHPIKPIRRRVK